MSAETIKKYIAKKKKRSAYRMSRIKTRLLKRNVPKDLLPLYNHLLRLADDSHKRGYTKRAGIELRKARRLAAPGYPYENRS